MATLLEKLRAVREFYIQEIEHACEHHNQHDDVEQQADRMIRAAEVIRAIDLALPTTEANQQSACEKAFRAAQPWSAKRPG
jgi:hypothetical protein